MAISEDMHRVAHHLQMTAVAAAANERDSYARSCYNRYYYSVFLQCREMLSDMDASWSRIAHASYPELLGGKVRKAFKTERIRASKSGDKDLVKLIDKACRSIAELQKIIITANSTRVVADYEPEEKVDFVVADRFSLRSISVTEAHGWTISVQTHCRTILNAWRQSNA
jgi:hypothetical protein